jgi:hypothetical protein
MPKAKRKKAKRPKARGLTLAPMTFEEAVKRALTTPLPTASPRGSRRSG